MTKRERIYNKFGGRCAYTGKPLGDDWQVDHVRSKIMNEGAAYYQSVDLDEISRMIKSVDNIDNLFPAIRIVNHYKRSLDLEGFRDRMTTFHKRLAKQPKNPVCERSIRRKEYMCKVADAFGITHEKPFSGKFYFETLKEVSL